MVCYEQDETQVLSTGGSCKSAWEWPDRPRASTGWLPWRCKSTSATIDGLAALGRLARTQANCSRPSKSARAVYGPLIGWLCNASPSPAVTTPPCFSAFASWCLSPSCSAWVLSSSCATTNVLPTYRTVCAALLEHRPPPPAWKSGGIARRRDPSGCTMYVLCT